MDLRPCPRRWLRANVGSDMLNFEFFTQPSGQRMRLRVVDGRAACPLLADVDLERCLECPYLIGFEDGSSLFVVCQAPLRSEAPIRTLGCHHA